jgi:hypothetical protein
MMLEGDDLLREERTQQMKPAFLRFAVGAFLAFVSPKAATSQENFYSNKTVKILVATATGSYDAYARLVARYLPAHLANGVTAIVQAMPGATIKVPLYLKEVVPNDSTVIAGLNNAAAFAPLFGVPHADFDPTKFQWLGSPASDVALLVIWHTVPVQTIDDVTKREVLLGVGSGGSSAYFFGRLINTVFHTKFKLLTGYSGIGPIYLAMERGEVEGVPAALWSDLQLSRPDWVPQKQVKILLQYGGSPVPELHGVPVARTLIKNDDDRKLFDIGMAPLDMGRPYTMAPDADAANVKLMRAAIMATFTDKGFVEDAKKQRLAVDATPKSGEDLLRVVTDAYHAPKETRDRLTALYSAGGETKK